MLYASLMIMNFKSLYLFLSTIQMRFTPRQLELQYKHPPIVDITVKEKAKASQKPQLSSSAISWSLLHPCFNNATILSTCSCVRFLTDKRLLLHVYIALWARCAHKTIQKCRKEIIYRRNYFDIWRVTSITNHMTSA